MRKIILFLPFLLFAGENIFNIKDLTVIYKNQTQGRIIFKVNFNFPKNAIVDAGYIVLQNFPVDTIQKEFHIEIFPISKNWDGQNVKWDFPWDTPGGDYYENMGEFFTFLAGENKNIKIDISPILRKWREGEIGNYGILIKAPDFENGVFPVERIVKIFNALKKAKIVVYTSLKEDEKTK